MEYAICDIIYILFIVIFWVLCYLDMKRKTKSITQERKAIENFVNGLETQLNNLFEELYKVEREGIDVLILEAQPKNVAEYLNKQFEDFKKIKKYN